MCNFTFAYDKFKLPQIKFIKNLRLIYKLGKSIKQNITRKFEKVVDKQQFHHSNH